MLKSCDLVVKRDNSYKTLAILNKFTIKKFLNASIKKYSKTFNYQIISHQIFGQADYCSLDF